MVFLFSNLALQQEIQVETTIVAHNSTGVLVDENGPKNILYIEIFIPTLIVVVIGTIVYLIYYYLRRGTWVGPRTIFSQVSNLIEKKYILNFNCKFRWACIQIRYKILAIRIIQEKLILQSTHLYCTITIFTDQDHGFRSFHTLQRCCIE